MTHRRAADPVHATKASCSEPSAAKETPADGLAQRQATAASSSVGIGEAIGVSVISRASPSCFVEFLSAAGMIQETLERT